jgi:hypothetical protein
MNTYTPDKWLIIKITQDEAIHYRVFGCWFGGFAGRDSWKMNSGVTKVSFDDNFYKFEGSSGSVYMCHKDTYGANMYGRGVINDMIHAASKQGVIIEILEEDTNFLSLHYE